ALDEALVPHASRLRIGKSNFRLRSDITSKESILQVVYDVLKLTPFYKAFLVIADVPKIYMEMLHICPRIPNQPFDELPFVEEILAFLRNLGHGGEIKKITNVNINKLHQPWRSFVVVINKCLSGKSTGYDSHRQLFMTKDTSILRRNKVNWHYVRDDQMFTTIKLVLRNQNTQQFDAILLVELTNEDIINFAAYKEYYAIASEAEPLKTKSSVRKKQCSSDTTMPPLVAKGTRLQTSANGKQPAKSSKAKGLTVLSKVALIEAEQIKLATKRSPTQTHISQASRSGIDEGTGLIPGVPDVPTYESDEEISWKSSDEDDDDDVKKESFDPIVQTPSHMENSNDEGNDDARHGIDSLFESTPRVDVPVTTIVEPLLLTAPTLPPPFIPTISQVQQAPEPSPATAPSTSLHDHLNFAVTSILGIVDRYLDHRMNEAVKVAIIKEQVKEQVKVQVSKMLPKIRKTVNEHLEAEVLTRVSNSSKTSYVVAADLSELELKKILIEKIERNKSIHRSDQQKNLYKALVDAYECDKIILDTYIDTVTLKRRRDDEDKDEEPFAGSDQGSKRRRAAKEPKSTSAPKEKASKTSGKSTEGSKSHQKTASESAPAEEPMQTT
nr:hypothetical protein [Tanacetum cinerariifolium]